jgi:hypothetical protein
MLQQENQIVVQFARYASPGQHTLPGQSGTIRYGTRDRNQVNHSIPTAFVKRESPDP